MTTPTDVIVAHLEAVKAAFAEAGGPVKAWNLLRDTCPEIAAGMALNSFRVLAPVVLGTAARLTPPLPPPPSEPAPRNFLGWTISRDRAGRIRYHRRLGGKLRSVYLGATFDPVKAREKIVAAEREITDSRGG